LVKEGGYLSEALKEKGLREKICASRSGQSLRGRDVAPRKKGEKAQRELVKCKSLWNTNYRERKDALTGVKWGSKKSHLLGLGPEREALRQKSSRQSKKAKSKREGGEKEGE